MARLQRRDKATQRNAIRRTFAALLIALGLTLAQPAIAAGHLFRVGQITITETGAHGDEDRHRRICPGADPAPLPETGVSWSLVVWRAPDCPDDRTLEALARGDPRPRYSN